LGYQFAEAKIHKLKEKNCKYSFMEVKTHKSIFKISNLQSLEFLKIDLWIFTIVVLPIYDSPSICGLWLWHISNPVKISQKEINIVVAGYNSG
jgi:hypothetical protein